MISFYHKSNKPLLCEQSHNMCWKGMQKRLRDYLQAVAAEVMSAFVFLFSVFWRFGREPTVDTENQPFTSLSGQAFPWRPLLPTRAPALHGRPSQLPVLLVMPPVWTRGSPAVPTVRPLPRVSGCVPAPAFGPRRVPASAPSRSPRGLVCAAPARRSPPRTRLLHQVLLSNIAPIRCLLSGFSKTIASTYSFTWSLELTFPCFLDSFLQSPLSPGGEGVCSVHPLRAELMSYPGIHWIKKPRKIFENIASTLLKLKMKHHLVMEKGMK